MPCYDYVNGVLRKAKEYDYVGGALREVKQAFDYVEGSLREYTGLLLHDLELGSRILFNDQYYTLIAKDYCVEGDAILWAEYSGGQYESNPQVNKMADAGALTTDSPFGPVYTNEVTITYNRPTPGTSGAEFYSVTAYGWAIPIMAYNIYPETIYYGNGIMPYFYSDGVEHVEHRIRATRYLIPDTFQLEGSGSNLFRAFISTTGEATRDVASKTVTRDFYYAFSLIGSVPTWHNADGTYSLAI